MPTITIPFKPREYQKPLNEFILGGGKRAFVEWHRRAGKDLDMWNLTIRIASQKKGLYFYFLPTYTQAKKVIWDGMTNDGIKFLDFIPKEMRDGEPNATEMKTRLRNGSIIQVVGTDKFDAIRGTNPVGCVFSEFAYQNPMAWDVVRPILKANGGWALFNTTPQGENHSHDMGEMAKLNSKWFYQVLTIADTGVLTEQDMDEEREEGMDEDMIQQEYYCSHKIGARGSFYASLVQEAIDQGRVTHLPVEPHLSMDIVQDIGRNDSYSIGFVQKKGNEIRFVDFEEDNGKEVAHYIEMVLKKKYTIRFVWLPHDSRQKRVEAKNSVWEQGEEAGFKCRLVPKHGLGSGIQETRKKFKRFLFDKTTCMHLLKCLKNYHKEWDPVAQVFRPTPKHDWSSHASDMVRYVAVSWEDEELASDDTEEAITDFIDEDEHIHPQVLSMRKDLVRMEEYRAINDFID
ncbi:MAG: hypothetical protein KAS32_06815 [Candidatus Peribacteraceae bacterium]|nr:hypothetical protein [Candidatus Peribacteraceae bacterium]